MPSTAEIVAKACDGFDRKRENLIPLLQEVQESLGYLPEEAVCRISEYLGISENDTYGVATFYTQFRFTPPGKHCIKVCQGTACHVRGSGLIRERVSRKLGIQPGETTPDLEFSLERVACVGSCALAPVVVIDDTVHARMTAAKVEKRINEVAKASKSQREQKSVPVLAGLPPVCSGPVHRNGHVTFADLQASATEAWNQFVKPGSLRVLVGSATCGRAAGSMDVLGAFRHELQKRGVSDTVQLAEVGCNGLCFAEVLVEIQAADGRRVLYQNVNPRIVPELIDSHLLHGNPVRRYALALMEGEPLDGLPRFQDLPVIKPQTRVILRNCGIIDPLRIQHYIARGGYSGLAKGLSMNPEAVIDEITRSGLRGRGGAGFPTGTKWTLARNTPDAEKYVVCNADEGDPGAFMNRSVLEGDPHAVLEGLMIAGHAVGAATGYVYVRAEYPLAVERIHHSLREMEANGLLGRNILGSDFSFEIKVKKGAGAFVCGEETALMASIEGARGMPRAKPPFPVNSGLFKRPTSINNVETLAAASVIMEKGADWYAGFGTGKSRGTKTFSLAGKIRNTGLIEVALGTPLRAIIEDIGGGCTEGKAFKAVQTGGPSGGCIPASLLDTPVDYEHLAAVGSIMGSGGLVVLDEDACMVDVARYFLSFTENESCGKCVPCRMGTQHLLSILTDITEGRGTRGHIEQIRKIADAMKKGSLCGLGQTAPNPALTTLKYFENEYLAHIGEHTCPAGVCRELITFSIDESLCTGCRLCATNCPADAISGEKLHAHFINQGICIRCGACLDVCQFEAVKLS